MTMLSSNFTPHKKREIEKKKKSPHTMRTLKAKHAKFKKGLLITMLGTF